MFKYPWGNLQGLNLAWFLEKFNQLLEDWATAEAGIDGALDDEIQKAEDALSDVFDARDAAAASATAAAGSATQAGTSATAAASSATLANNKATAAGLSEANAAQSASQAAGSATTASNAATQAGTSATAAGNSATAAAGSATQAGNSATAAAGSATAAATSETNAAASAQEAEDVLDSIPADYSTLASDVTKLTTAITDYIINAKTDFGAKGDGSTDDTTALQNCFDYAAEHGAIAFLPSGVYMVSAPLINKGAHITGASISIQEEAPTTVIKASNSFTTTPGASNGVLNCLAQQTPYSDFIIENITINANSKQYNALHLRVSAVCNNVYCTGGLLSGLYCLNSYHAMFTRCIFNHNAKYGINIDQRNNSIEFINCIINDNGTASADANVMIDNTTYNAVNNNACIYFIGCEIDKAIAGSNVSINGVDTLTFDACYFEQFSDACFTTRGLKVNALNIVNSYFLDVNFNLTFNGTFIGNAFRLINAASGIARATQPSGGDLLKAGNYYDAGYTTT